MQMSLYAVAGEAPATAAGSNAAAAGSGSSQMKSAQASSAAESVPVPAVAAAVAAVPSAASIESTPAWQARAKDPLARRMRTIALIWRLKQKKAAAGAAAMLPLMGQHLTASEQLVLLDVNARDSEHDSLLGMCIQLAAELDRMDEDDAAEVAA